MKKTQDSLTKMKRRRVTVLVAALALIGIVYLYSAFKVDPEERKINRLKDVILSRPDRQGLLKHLPENGGKDLKDAGASSEYDRIASGGNGLGGGMSRKELKNALRELSPKTRKRLAREVMRERLKEARRRMEGLNEEQKKKAVDDMIHDVRKRFDDMSLEKREKAKQDFNSPEGKDRLKEAFDFYFNEFSAKERELMDPLVNEILTNIDAL